MPISVAEIVLESAKVSVPVKGGQINLTIAPYAWTPAIESELLNLDVNVKQASGKLVKAMVGDAETNQAALILEWDLAWEDDGPPIPLTFEEVRKVPSKIIYKLLTAISQEIAGGE
jgi:hypothetical protein